MKKVLFLCAVCLSCAAILRADEGMYPISEIGKLNLRSKGLAITAAEIYNPAGTSLIDAIVSLGGCTGSFVSPGGLIITNHHCVFGYVQAASSVERDYLTSGFLARARNEELPAKGATVRITDAYRDVSARVLAALADTMTPGERARATAKAIRAIVRESEEARPGTTAEVAEMFAGKSYVLFEYTTLRDVRLVYVPPRSIGEFGGEEDNWVWPRHTGDFAFLRAYVAPDGSPAAYAPDNVPYRPRKFLTVQPKGVEEEDPVFILGYPGRTYRHRTSHYLAFEEEVRMPAVAGFYEWQIETMTALGKGDRSVALKHDARIKGLANTSKNYRGKLKGMARLGLVAGKREEERRLQEWIDADPARRELFGKVLSETAGVYREMAATAQRDLALGFLRSGSTLLNCAFIVRDAAAARALPAEKQDGSFAGRQFERTRENLRTGYRNLYLPTEQAMLAEVLRRVALLPDDERIAEVDSMFGGRLDPPQAASFAERALRETRLADPAMMERLLELPIDSIEAIEDPFLALARACAPASERMRLERQEREGSLARLAALFVDAKAEFLKKGFIPDANGTLRFTSGRIRGFSPADATRYEPITTLRGVVEKTTGIEPYRSPARLLELYRKGGGRYVHPRLREVPVDLLYDLDTTGGNSGSPLLNGRGELVGVNFDRAFEATINDFAWSEAYSRSIAVDIRYVLWVTEYVGGATHLLKEMGL